MKVQNGTPRSGNLCDSCSYARKLTYQNGKIHLECLAMGGGDSNLHLEDEVTSCNAYARKDEESLYELKEKAWIIEVSRSNKIGFVSPMQRLKRGDIIT